MKKTIRGAFFLLTLFCSEAVATPSYLHIEGIQGEVRVKDYEDWIDIWSFNFAIAQGGLHGGPSFSEFSVVKQIDKASPLLFRQATVGGQIPVVIIDFFRDSAAEPRYLRVRLSDVIVSGYSMSHDEDGGSVSSEVVSLNFDRIELEQTKPDYSGTTRVYYDIDQGKGGALPDGPPPSDNTPPTITAIPDETLPVNSSVVVNFTIDDLETSADFLVLSRESSNPALVPVSNIVFGGSGNNRTATITPGADSFGSSAVTIRVSDGIFSAASQFTVTVEQPEGPFIGSIADVTVGDGDSVSVPFTVAHPTADLNTLIVTAVSDNQQLLPNDNIGLGGTGANRTAQLTPATGTIGEAEVTITVGDGTDVAARSFLLTVEPVTPPPVIVAPVRVQGVAGSRLFVGGLSISDPAAGDAAILVTLNAPGALLTVADDIPEGLIAADIQGNDTSAIVISAPLTAINATLSASDGLGYSGLSPGSAEISIEATRSGGSSKSIEVFLFDSRLSLWRSEYFSDEDLNDSEKEATHWGDMANPTGDGIRNFLKYALGLSPLENHASSSLPAVYLIEEGEQRYVAFTLVRRTDDPSLEYIPEISFNLFDWESGGGAFEEHSTAPAGDGLEQVVYRRLLSGDGPAGQFVRLQVTRILQ